MMEPASSSKQKRAQSQSSSKRLKGLLKKASELSILCQVQLCMICYPPNSTSEPTTLPKDQPAVEKLIELYLGAKNSGSIKQVASPDDYVSSKNTGRKKEPCVELQRAQQPAFEYSLWHPELDKCPQELLRSLLTHLEKKNSTVNLEIMKRVHCFSPTAVNDCVDTNHAETL